MALPAVSVLRVVAGPAAGGAISLGANVVVGREGQPGGVSFAGDEEMARRHAVFRPLPTGAAVVEDLGSGTGTLVNGERIEIPRLLSPGDEITLGRSVVVLERSSTRGSGSAEATLPAPPPRSLSSAETTLPAPPPQSPPDPAAAGARARRGVAPPARRGLLGSRRGLAVGAGFLLAGAGLVAGLIAGRHGRGGPPGPDTPAGTGTVYLESGSAQPGGNAVLAFRYHEGANLQPLSVTAYPTGGAGGFDLTNTGALDADGQVVTSPDGTLLFAVNQGSDTVAVFHVRPDGSLAPVTGSPFPSQGAAPGGLAMSGDRLVVVNKAQDGVRNLVAVAPNITTFLVAADGVLHPTGSVVTLAPASSPTEALISPDGRVVVVPLEHGPFASLTMTAAGGLTEAPGSPFSLPDAIFPAGQPRSQRWALGLGALPAGGYLYGQVVDTAQLAVYRYDDSGRLTFVTAVADPGAYLPCWSLLNAAGTRLYTDNAGNNTMSVFDLTDPARPRLLQVVALKDAGNPWDLKMAPGGRAIFVLDARDRQDLVPAGQGNELHTLLVDADGTLTEPAYSPVPIPVPLNTNPIGLAVVGR